MRRSVKAGLWILVAVVLVVIFGLTAARRMQILLECPEPVPLLEPKNMAKLQRSKSGTIDHEAHISPPISWAP